MTAVPEDVLELHGANEGPRSRRAAILVAAVEEFSRLGYDATRWADVAERVGIGQPALYHYFGSKTHCLLTIMRMELQRSADQFTRATRGISDPTEALHAALRDLYDVSAHEAMQIRVLHSNIAILSNPQPTRDEEAERLMARRLVRRIEDNWTQLIRHGMETGAFPQRDPRLLAQAVLGVILSVWRWYRPGAQWSLDEVGDIITELCQQMVMT